MSYWRKVFAGGDGSSKDTAGSQTSPGQSNTPTSGNGDGGGNGFVGMPVSSPNTSSQSALALGGLSSGLKSFGNTLTAAGSNRLVPQGIVNAVQSRKVAGQVSTLLLRIQTSTLGRDRREAVGELCDLKPSEVAEHIHPEDLSMLLMVAEMNRNDTQLVTKLFELIGSITEERVVSDSVRDVILQELLQNHVSVFLDSLAPITSSSNNRGGPSPPPDGAEDGINGGGDSISEKRAQTFWIRYHAVKILQRIQEHDGIALQKQLLTNNSLSHIIDILHDSTNDGALRSEGMILLEHVTMTDMELQTILAFDSGFETLLGIVQSEGGVNGDVTAVDCLRIIHNMLRNNKATQKFFREMGLAASLKSLLTDTCSAHTGAGSPDGRLTAKGVEVVLSSIDIVQCLLRFGDGNSEGIAARDSVAHAGLVEPLCRVAFSSKLDDRTSIAALRVVALLAVSHKPTGEGLLMSRIGYKEANHVPALWACLHVALYHNDLTHQAAALQLIGAAMQTAGTGAQVASFLVKGLAPTTGGAAAVPTQQSTREGGLQCGLLLSLCLMHVSPPTPNSRYYAAWVLNQSLLVPQITEQMLFLPFGQTSLAGGVGLRQVQQTFFMAYLRQLEETIRTRQCNLATVAMLIRPLFTWFAFCGKGIYLFLGWTGNNNSNNNNNANASASTNPSQPTSPPGAPSSSSSSFGGLSSFNFFLEWSNNTRDPMHLRFMCAMVCVAAAVACPSHDLPPSVQTNKEDLIRRFCASVRLGMLEELLYNVSSSPEWTEPPTNILHARTSALILYDKDYVAILTELANTARKWLTATSSSVMMMTAAGHPPIHSHSHHQLQPPQQPSSHLVPSAGHPTNPHHLNAPANNASPHTNISPTTAPAATTANNVPPCVASQQQQQQQQQHERMLQQQQQQLQQYETFIRQLQSELKTKEDAIVELTVANEKLTFQNDELETAVEHMTARGASSGQPPTTTTTTSASAEVIAAKDAEISNLRTLLEKLERRLEGKAVGGSTAAAAPQLSAAAAAPSPRAMDTSRTTATDVDALQHQLEDFYAKMRVLESERDELLILVAELDEENELLKQINEEDGDEGLQGVVSAATSLNATAVMNQQQHQTQQPATLPHAAASSTSSTAASAVNNASSSTAPPPSFVPVPAAYPPQKVPQQLAVNTSVMPPHLQPPQHHGSSSSSSSIAALFPHRPLPPPTVSHVVPTATAVGVAGGASSSSATNNPFGGSAHVVGAAPSPAFGTAVGRQHLCVNSPLSNPSAPLDDSTTNADPFGELSGGGSCSGGGRVGFMPPPPQPQPTQGGPALGGVVHATTANPFGAAPPTAPKSVSFAVGADNSSNGLHYENGTTTTSTRTSHV